MSIRWKLLISMLCISILPLLIVRWINLEQIQKMGDVLAADTRKTIVQKAEEIMHVLVEEHIQLIRHEKNLTEMALRVQAAEFEKRLQTKSNSQYLIYDIDELDYGKYFRVMGNDALLPLKISFRTPVMIQLFYTIRCRTLSRNSKDLGYPWALHPETYMYRIFEMI